MPDRASDPCAVRSVAEPRDSIMGPPLSVPSRDAVCTTNEGAAQGSLTPRRLRENPPHSRVVGSRRKGLPEAKRTRRAGADRVLFPVQTASDLRC